jgi:hypothetical protein
MMICRQNVNVGDLLLDDINGIPYEIVAIDEEAEVVKCVTIDDEDEWNWEFTKQQVERMVKGGFTRLITNGSLWW